MLVELFLLVLLIGIVVLVIRRGKTAAQDDPLVIHSPGKYHITLAPQLDHAQTLIELIAAKFSQSHPPQDDLPTRFFEVHDPDLLAKGEGFYLLAAGYRGGLLYFQAVNPQPLLRDADSHLKQVREFSEAVLAQHPLGHQGGGEAEKLRGAVEMAVQQLKITVKMLPDTGL